MADKGLLEILRERDQVLLNRAQSMIPKCREALEYIPAKFPYFTPHDFDHHSLGVERIANWLIPDDVKQGLNKYEIFFLLISCWLHDWGMMGKEGEDAKEVRRTHHVRTEENFEKLYDKLGLDPVEARIIGRISRGHRVEDLNGDLFRDQFFSNENFVIRVSFLAAVLRIADECDITYNRVPEIIIHSLDPRIVTEEHFKEHLQIGGVGLLSPYKIGFSGTAKDQLGVTALHKVEEKIQGELDSVKDILRRGGIPVEVVEAQILKEGFDDRRISFRLDQKRVMQLLIGRSLYSRTDVAIRELLQNSVDACRARQLQESIEAEIRIYEEDGAISISDNGIGMDYDRALAFLANKGISYYQSSEFEEMNRRGEFDPISRWGLGILSCFMIASKIIIESKKQDGALCRFEIDDVSDEWKYNCEEGGQTGTKVTLILNDEGKKIKLRDSLRHHIKQCDIPIFLGKDSKQPMKLDWTINDPDVRKEIDARKDEWGPLRQRLWSYEDDALRIKIYFVNGPAQAFVCNQGFFVQQLEDNGLGINLIPVPWRAIVLIDTKREVFDLNVSRERLVTTGDRFRAFESRWVAIVFSLFKKAVDRELAKLEGSIIERISFVHYALMWYGIGLSDKWLEEKLGTATFGTQFPVLRDYLYNELPIPVVEDGVLKEMTFERLSAIAPSKIGRYVLSNTGQQNVKAEIEFIQPNVNNENKNNLTVLAFYGTMPTSFPTNGEVFEAMLRKFVGPNVVVEDTNLQMFLFSVRLDRSTTRLDEYLPSGCYFSDLPKNLRSGVICNRPFVVKYTGGKNLGVFPPLEMDFTQGEQDLSSIGTELWGPFYRLPYLLSKRLAGSSDESNFFAISENASFVLDINDVMVKTLLSLQNDTVYLRADGTHLNVS